jgi:pimeloyl-ACP methyl ester carboxylesterase
VDRSEASGSDSLVTHLQELGAEVSHQQADGVAVALDRPTEEAEVAVQLVEAVVAWVGPAPDSDSSGSSFPERPVTAMEWRGQEIHEEFVELGDHRLAGVRTWTAEHASTTVVFLNSGSEAHIGPGRAWVELARDLALAGSEALRIDFRGWGESPDDGFAPGRPYDLHTWEDAAEIVGALRDAGDTDVYLAGVCAGAWVSLKEATRTTVDGVIAINPQMYWQPGDPVEALITDTRQRRMPEIEYWKREGAELERAQPPHPAGEWLEQLRAREVPTLALFSRGDDGLEFLESRLPETWQAALDSGLFEVVEVGIDHPLHQYWRRGELSDAITAFLARRRG